MRKHIYIILTSLLLVSCYKKYDLSNIKPMENYQTEWVAPLVNSDITLADIVEQYQENIDALEDYDLYLEEGDDHLYTVVYENSTETGDFGDLYAIPDFESSNTLSIPIDEIPSEIKNDTVPEYLDSVYTEEFGDTITIDLPSFYDASLDKILLDGGTFLFSVNSNFNQVLEMEFTFASLQKNSETLVIHEVLSETKSNFTYEIDLANYVIDLTTSGASNQIEIITSAKMMFVEGTYFPEDGEISYEVAMSDFDFERIEGNVGIFTFDTQTGSLPISLFDNIEYLDNITFVDPKLQFTASSTVGATASLILDNIEFSGIDGTTTALDANPNTISVDAHPDYNDYENPTVSTFEVNKDNSNISEALTSAPNNIKYSVAATFGQAEGQDFWVSNQSSVTVGLKAELPMDLMVSNIVYYDTMDITLPSSEEVTNALDRVEIKIIGNNGFGYELGVQGYWVTSNFEVLDSLFSDGTQYIIESAEVDSEGYPINTTSVTSTIEMSADQYEYIADNATRLIYQINFHTYKGGSENIKLLSTNSFELKMGVLIATDVNTDEYDTGL